MKVDIKSVKLLSTSSANIELSCLIKNPSRRTFVIEDAEALLKRGGANFANATMIKADTIVPESQKLYTALFKVEITDPLSLLSMGLNMSRWDLSDFKIDARTIVKPSGMSRKILKFRDLPMEKLIEKL